MPLHAALPTAASGTLPPRRALEAPARPGRSGDQDHDALRGRSPHLVSPWGCAHIPVPLVPPQPWVLKTHCATGSGGGLHSPRGCRDGLELGEEPEGAERKATGRGTGCEGEGLGQMGTRSRPCTRML